MSVVEVESVAGRLQREVDSKREELRVMVDDKGIGLSKGQTREIFDQFGKMPCDPDCKQLRMGLGLTVSKMIVNQYGGDITVSSKGKGFGSSFIFTMKFKLGFTLDSVMARSSKVSDPKPYFARLDLPQNLQSEEAQ